MSLVKVKTKSQVTIPDAIRQKLGVEVGDILEARIENGSIILRPKVIVDRDEYTPAQRRRIDAELAKSVAEYKEGKSYGPFETHQEMINFLHQQVKQSRPRKATTTKRRAR
jgi:AbrB family looped-hinge helix DNA binding protein